MRLHGLKRVYVEDDVEETMTRDPTPITAPTRDDVARALARLDERLLDAIRAAREAPAAAAPGSIRELVYAPRG